MKKQAPILVIAVILLLIANLGYWLSKTIYNPQNFSNLAVQTFEQDEVRNAIAEEVVDNSLESKPVVKQVLGDPVKSAIAGILGSQPFKTALEEISVKFQNYLTTDNRQDVTLEVGQLAPFIKSAATSISPELGAQIPDVTPQTITLVRADSLPDINKWLKPIMTIGPIAGVISLLLLVYIFYKSVDKVALAKRTSIYFLIGILLFALLIPYFRTVLQGNIADQNAQIIATAIYNSFTGALITQLAILAAIFAFVYLAGYLFSFRKKTLE